MKKALVLFTILAGLTLANPVAAQIEKGKIELSFAGSFMGVKESDKGFEAAFNLAGRFGYFITKEFEIEPEIIFSVYSEDFGPEDAGFIMSANFVYNLSLVETSNIAPFFLAGVGWANSLHYFNQMNLGDYERNWTVLNLGVGSKFFLSRSAAFRFEYRFQRFFGEKETFYWYSYDTSVSYHNILFGFSIFL